MALIYSEEKAVSAAVFTKNLAKAAPIILDIEHVKNKNTQAIVVNSGNANYLHRRLLDLRMLKR